MVSPPVGPPGMGVSEAILIPAGIVGVYSPSQVMVVASSPLGGIIAQFIPVARVEMVAMRVKPFIAAVFWFGVETVGCVRFDEWIVGGYVR